MPIAPTVVLGKGVMIFQPDLVNLYGCTIGDETKIGAFVEIQKNAFIGARCKVSSHTFVCEGVTIEDEVFVGHGVMFINDIYPRATGGRRAADRGGLDGGDDAREARRVDRQRRRDPRRRHHRGGRAGRRGCGGDHGRARPRDRRRECRRGSGGTPARVQKRRHGRREAIVIRIGVIGYGYWGPNLVRNFYETPGAQVAWVSDLRAERLKQVQSRYPTIKVTENHRELIDDPAVDAVLIATPVSTHFDLAMPALQAGKHVFVEKPLASTAEQVQRLIDEAREGRSRVLMVDHTFVYTGAVRKIRELVDGGSLGDIYYYDSTRVNLGLFQHDVNVIWDLAVHDLSIMDYVLPFQPVAVSATGLSHVPGEKENIAFLTLFFGGTADRPHPRELAGAGEGAPDPDRSQRADDRVRRPGAEREGQGLRQGHHRQPQAEPGEDLPDPGRVPHGRHARRPTWT